MVRPRHEHAPPRHPMPGPTTMPPPPPPPRPSTRPSAAPAPGPGLDPNQTYILSGPYMRVDERSGMLVTVFAARPVPPGLTVIATPKQMPMLVPTTSTMPTAMMSSMATSPPMFNPEAAPFYPKRSDTDRPKGEQVAKWNPCFLVFNPQCPEGKLMPLRQPQPPVYFQQEMKGNSNGNNQQDLKHV